jgi:hypothetical protein
MHGIHVQVRLGEDPKVCLLILTDVREDGVKELLAVEDGYRESTEGWAGVFRDLKRRGLNEPKLVVGDGALGAWAALRAVFPSPADLDEPTRERIPHEAACDSLTQWITGRVAGGNLTLGRSQNPVSRIRHNGFLGLRRCKAPGLPGIYRMA